MRRVNNSMRIWVGGDTLEGGVAAPNDHPASVSQSNNGASTHRLLKTSRRIGVRPDAKGNGGPWLQAAARQPARRGRRAPVTRGRPLPRGRSERLPPGDGGATRRQCVGAIAAVAFVQIDGFRGPANTPTSIGVINWTFEAPGRAGGTPALLPVRARLTIGAAGEALVASCGLGGTQPGACKSDAGLRGIHRHPECGLDCHAGLRL